MRDACAEYRFRDRASDQIAAIDAALERGEIDEWGWHVRVADLIRAAYLSGKTPEEQSGFSGGPLAWQHARAIIADAIDRDGTFLDVGCASGLLMESISSWGAAKGFRVEPYGVDIVPELAALARSRLPRWADRIFVGNALTWRPPMAFDYVRTGLEYVPPRRRWDLIEHLLRHALSPNGRLIIGVYTNAEPDGPGLENIVQAWGYRVAGHAERPHRNRLGEVQRVLWLDAPTRTMSS